ncbi:MAG: ABC transporter ATP-binding protein [Actinobacteria bacterium]|nr:ABC transporter ATP-binding protein [Actinomycetota bacterium]
MIRVSGLTKKFKGITAVDSVTMEVARGDIFGLVGPDGSGKTTLLRLIVGIITPTAGAVSISGAGGGAGSGGKYPGYMPQRFSLYGDLTVMENINFFGRLYNLSRKTISRRADEILELTNLSSFKARFADNLSGGMKQKLALTCALLSRPDLIILDEPTFGVDPESRKDFWKILYSLNGEGITILVSTAYMDEAELCRKVAFMSGGRLAAVDTPVNLKRNFPFKILELKAGLGDPESLAGLPGILDADMFGDRYHIRVADAGAGRKVLEDFLAARAVDDFTLREVPASIEDIFVALAESEAV